MLFLDLPMNQLVRGGHNGDLFGVELEMEGQRVVSTKDGGAIRCGGWTPHADGSLRNNHGESIEWVMRAPRTYEDTIKLVESLYTVLAKNDAKQVCSNRTSTHVHFNMFDKKVYQVVNLFCLYSVLEDLLGAYCGEDRHGNVFCLSTKQASHLNHVFYQAVVTDQTFGNFGEDLRYAGLNISALNKFGSVEFRTMRGLDNAEQVNAWVSIINDMVEYACWKMKSPVAMIFDISNMGTMPFLETVFSKENVERLTKNVDEAAVRQSMVEGFRSIQMLAYKLDEDFSKVKRITKDFWAEMGKKTKKTVEVDEDVEDPFPFPDPADRVRIDFGRFANNVRPAGDPFNDPWIAQPARAAPVPAPEPAERRWRRVRACETLQHGQRVLQDAALEYNPNWRITPTEAGGWQIETRG